MHTLDLIVRAAVPPDSWYGTLLKGTVNFSPATTWLELVVWVAYVVPTMILFISKSRHGKRPAASSTAAKSPASVAVG
jgi:high-affinity iron transporter